MRLLVRGGLCTFTRSLVLGAGILTFASLRVWAGEVHAAQGMLLNIDRTHRTITVSCNAVPGYMDAMVMEFQVNSLSEFKSLTPGAMLRFRIVEGKHRLYAEQLQAVPAESAEAEPEEAARLEFLQRVIDPAVAARAVPVGGQVPDFTLVDRAQAPTRLADLRGKVVVVSFTYSRCPNPNYCFRLSTNLALLRKRFRGRMGEDLILLTIVIDPDNDRDKVLQEYADIWKANPKEWLFLSGALPEVRNVAELFGMNFWSDEGFLTHPFHTVVIDRNGRLAANVEGNQFTSTQLGDFVQTVLTRRPPS
jgi:protein SCO1